MAPKRLKEDPPPAATSSGEEEEGSENDAASDEEEEEHEVSNAVQEKEKSGGDDDDDDEEEDQDDDEESPAGKLTVIPSSNKVSNSNPQSDNESGSGSDSESESDSLDDKSSPPSPSLSAYTIKPIASKPMEPKKSSAAAKPINSKKRKAVVSSSAITNGDDEDSKKHTGGVPRLWSDENELAVLKGMIEYKSKKGLDPVSDMGDFHEFIKKNISVEVSKNQLVDKIRRMKKKYLVNVEKARDNGENPVFSKPHEHKSFELSKKIWGSEAGSSRKAKPPTRSIANNNINSNNNLIAIALPAKKKEKEKEKDACLDNGEVKDEKEEEFVASYPCLNSVLESGEEGFSRLGKRFKMELVTGIGSAKATELENKWKKVREAELEVYVKRVELVHEQAKLMLEAFKNRA